MGALEATIARLEYKIDEDQITFLGFPINAEF